MVVSVTDGDTIKVRLADGREEKVRYIGINTPEMDQPFGEEAKSANQALVTGREVRLVRDVRERDRYGRLLRYVYVDGLFVNAELVRIGYAQAVTYPRTSRSRIIWHHYNKRRRRPASACGLNDARVGHIEK